MNRPTRGHAHTPSAAAPTPPKQARPKLGRASGAVMMAVGALLLCAVGAYYAYGATARAQLGDLNFDAPAAAQPNADAPAPMRPAARQPQRPQPAQPATVAPAHAASDSPRAAQASADPQPPALAIAAPAQPVAVASASAPQQPDANAQAAPAAVPRELPAGIYDALYPAQRIHPKFWAQPLWAGGEPYLYQPGGAEPQLPDGFRPISTSDGALFPGDGTPTRRIAVPLIGIDSAITELAIIETGDSRAYETPKHIVGHIPQTRNPGELGNAWYFGHLESPVRGEGNVFRRLPEIPDLLRSGDAVYVHLEAEDGRAFLYEVSRTEVIPEDDLRLYNSSDARITLVTCVPRLIYDHRMVVTADLVGVHPAQSPAN